MIQKKKIININNLMINKKLKLKNYKKKILN